MRIGWFDRSGVTHVAAAMCVAAMLALGGCDRAVPERAVVQNMAPSMAVGNQAAIVAPAPAPVSTPVPAATSAVSEPLQKAFAAVFGASSPIVDAQDPGAPITTKAEKLLTNGDSAILITSSEVKDGCHACAGKLGVYYLKATDDAFTVTGKWPDAVVGGGYGKAPGPWWVNNRFGAEPALYAEGASSGQGYSCRWFDLTGLAPDGPKPLAHVPLGYDDSGANDKNANSVLDGEIVEIVPDKSFTVRYSGSDDFTETWIRKGNRYVVAGKSRMKSC